MKVRLNEDYDYSNVGNANSEWNKLSTKNFYYRKFRRDDASDFYDKNHDKVANSFNRLNSQYEAITNDFGYTAIPGLDCYYSAYINKNGFEFEISLVGDDNGEPKAYILVDGCSFGINDSCYWESPAFRMPVDSGYFVNEANTVLDIVTNGINNDYTLSEIEIAIDSI